LRFEKKETKEKMENAHSEHSKKRAPSKKASIKTPEFIESDEDITIATKPATTKKPAAMKTKTVAEEIVAPAKKPAAMKRKTVATKTKPVTAEIAAAAAKKIADSVNFLRPNAEFRVDVGNPDF
jgi:hypothetical protein